MVQANASSTANKPLAAFLFRRLWLLRIVQLIGAIRGGLFFGLFSESFVFELSNFGLGLIEFGLQLDISFDRVGECLLRNASKLSSRFNKGLHQRNQIRQLLHVARNLARALKMDCLHP